MRRRRQGAERQLCRSSAPAASSGGARRTKLSAGGGCPAGHPTTAAARRHPRRPGTPALSGPGPEGGARRGQPAPPRSRRARPWPACTRTCPPWPTAITRAARLTAVPKKSPSRSFASPVRSPHPHAELRRSRPHLRGELTLGGERGGNGSRGRRERGSRPVTHRREHAAAACLDPLPEHLVMECHRRPLHRPWIRDVPSKVWNGPPDGHRCCGKGPI